MTKLILTLSIILGLTGCVSQKQPLSLDYIAGNETFHLSKPCVEQALSAKEIGDDLPVNANNIFIKVKKGLNCSDRFKLFLARNLGKELFIHFDGKPVIKTRLGSMIHLEEGFHQAVKSKSLSDEILRALN
ncbi:MULTISPECIES: hypothetical protein [Photorhabdus]|uniref:Lipoprotein n=1 Tax=Photorhabdus laumondii subsp. clarkei TaxID=2029685 RepID=A0A329VKH0_9GAMM|nr:MULTISPECIES: hypothetical protein [Photorhabdus]MBS9431078.1 hypothetical protein [Photorhabdus hainanensis]RAW92403.1 hypothetical protein CKY01_05585 [Photorhabdus laumondii subsp. clarkei]